MKICWDELEKYQVWYYAKSGTFRVFKGSQWKSYVYHEACLKCGDPFLNPKKQDKFCCSSCANSYTNIELGRTFDREKAKETKLKKYGDENYNNREKAKETVGGWSNEKKKEVQLKKEETWIKNYGVTNPNKSKVVREKVESTNLERYGSTCSWGNDDVRRKCLDTTKEIFGIEDDTIVNVGQIHQIKEKIIETNLKRYGVECVFSLKKFRNVEKIAISRKALWDNATDEYRSQLAKRTSKMWGGFSEEKKCAINKKRSLRWDQKSSEEIKSIVEKIYKTKKNNGTWGCSKASQIFFWKLYNLLPDNLKGVCFFHDLNKEYCVERAFLDFKVGNCVIEYNGDLWHANPKKYKEDDLVISFSSKKVFAKDIWEREEKRNKMLIRNGYILMIIWESDVKRNESSLLDSCVNFITENYK